MKKEDLENFNKGRRIAEDISSVMLSESRTVSEETGEWLSGNTYSQEVVDKMRDEVDFSESLSRFGGVNRDHAIKKLSCEIKRKSTRRNLIRSLEISMAAAAVVALSLLVINFDNKTTDQPNIAVVVNNEAKNDVVNPVLILGDGVKIDLTHKNNVSLGEIMTIENAGNEFSNVDEGSEIEGDKSSAKEWYKIVIPTRFTYSTTLSDGTRVFLNANSVLEYPSSFSADIREVKLTGEAFFDVSKDAKRPFVVNVSDMKVKVYGTKFNINAYNTNCVRTSLVSGSVGVSLKDKKEIMIEPSQMLIVNSTDGVSEIGSFNVLKYEAWQNGYFRCDDEPISNVLEDIGRWYDVQFDFEFEESRNIKVSTSIKNNMSIEQVIKLLEVTSGVKFTKKGGPSYRVR